MTTISSHLESDLKFLSARNVYVNTTYYSNTNCFIMNDGYYTSHVMALR